MKGRTINELAIGQKAYLTKLITQSDIESFAIISGDHNPIHLDPVAAQKSVFRGTVAHGILVAGLISAVIGTELPGPGAIYLEQTLRFQRAVRPNDTIKATVEVIRIEPEKNRVRLKTTVSNQREEEVIVGEALIMLAKNKEG